MGSEVVTDNNAGRQIMARTIQQIWDEGNNEGNGYAIGTDDDTPADALDGAGYQNIMQGEPGYWVGRIWDKVTVVGDSHGPWAVDALASDDVVMLTGQVTYWKVID